MLANTQMISQGGGLWKCVACGVVKRKADIRRHIEAKHMQNVEVYCEKCGKTAKNRDSLRKHNCVMSY